LNSDEVKALTGMTSTAYDAQLAALIPLLEEEAMERTFNPTMTAGMRLYVAKKAKWLCDTEAGVTGESLGDYSVSRVAGEPPEIAALLKGSYRARIT
jgi:hypothetical protein